MYLYLLIYPYGVLAAVGCYQGSPVPAGEQVSTPVTLRKH